jgi:ferritin-like protein
MVNCVTVGTTAIASGTDSFDRKHGNLYLLPDGSERAMKGMMDVSESAIATLPLLTLVISGAVVISNSEEGCAIRSVYELY